MIPGMVVIEKVHGLQCTGISLSERFALMMAEHRARVLRNRKRMYINNQNRFRTWGLLGQVPLHMFQPQQQPIRQRLGMPGLRRFGSDGNLPGLKRSNSFGNLSNFRNRIPWRQSNSNMSRAGSVSNLSQASWHGNAAPVRARSVGPARGRMRGRGRRQAPRQVGQRRPPLAGSAARGNTRGRGAVRNQQIRSQQQKPVPSKEELDAQLDEYMASSQFVLDKELEEYMLKGSLMEFE